MPASPRSPLALALVAALGCSRPAPLPPSLLANRTGADLTVRVSLLDRSILTLCDGHIANALAALRPDLFRPLGTFALHERLEYGILAAGDPWLDRGCAVAAIEAVGGQPEEALVVSLSKADLTSARRPFEVVSGKGDNAGRRYYAELTPTTGRRGKEVGAPGFQACVPALDPLLRWAEGAPADGKEVILEGIAAEGACVRVSHREVESTGRPSTWSICGAPGLEAEWPFHAGDRARVLRLPGGGGTSGAIVLERTHAADPRESSESVRLTLTDSHLQAAEPSAKGVFIPAPTGCMAPAGAACADLVSDAYLHLEGKYFDHLRIGAGESAEIPLGHRVRLRARVFGASLVYAVDQGCTRKDRPTPGVRAGVVLVRRGPALQAAGGAH